MSLSSDAKQIALHFIEKTSGRATKAIMGKTINQAKSLLTEGYKKEEILNVIDYLIDVKKIDMFSLGYVNVSINSILLTINKAQNELIKNEKTKQVEKEVLAMNEENREVLQNDESTQRNKSKLNKFGVQSGVREKSFVDMFEKLGQNH